MGPVKGSPGKPWTIQQLSESDNEIRKDYANRIQLLISLHSHRLNADVGTSDPKVSTIPLTIYRSAQLTTQFHQKRVVLGGDASSGLVLRRGVNKAFIEATVLTNAIYQHFNDNEQQAVETPRAFVEYDQTARQLFENERWWVRVKAFGINFAKVSIKYVFGPVYNIVNKNLKSTIALTCAVAGVLLYKKFRR
jgi:hypothetical protein